MKRDCALFLFCIGVAVSENCIAIILKLKFQKIKNEIKRNIQNLKVSQGEIEEMVSFLSDVFYLSSKAKATSDIFDDVFKLCTLANITCLEKFVDESGYQPILGANITKPVQEYKCYLSEKMKQFFICQCLNESFCIDHPPAAHDGELVLELDLNSNEHYLKDVDDIIKESFEPVHTHVHMLKIVEKDDKVVVQCCFSLKFIKDIISNPRKKMDALKGIQIKVFNCPLLVDCKQKQFKFQEMETCLTEEKNRCTCIAQLMKLQAQKSFSGKLLCIINSIVEH